MMAWIALTWVTLALDTLFERFAKTQALRAGDIGPVHIQAVMRWVRVGLMGGADLALTGRADSASICGTMAWIALTWVMLALDVFERFAKTQALRAVDIWLVRIWAVMHWVRVGPTAPNVGGGLEVGMMSASDSEVGMMSVLDLEVLGSVPLPNKSW